MFMELTKYMIDKIKYLDTCIIYSYIKIEYINTSIDIPQKKPNGT
jgi:hypothetical protein